MNIIVATGNMNKAREIKDILNMPNLTVQTMKEANIDVEIIEDGKTFLENAMKKATAVYNASDKNSIVIADDSGICVDYLDGAPGIYSARFSGENATDEENNNKLLDLLKDVKPEDKTAKYVCSFAVIMPNGDTFDTLGEFYGILIDSPRGTNGFGYDPLFYLPEYQQTVAEISSELKNKISHRAIALEKLKEELNKRVQNV